MSNEILEAAATLYRYGIIGMRSETIIKYFDIAIKFRYYRKTMKYIDALEKTADDCFCSPELVTKATVWYNTHVLTKK